jgi:hypothetical protein
VLVAEQSHKSVDQAGLVELVEAGVGDGAFGVGEDLGGEQLRVAVRVDPAALLEGGDVISSSVSSSWIRRRACASSTRSALDNPGRCPRSTRSCSRQR